jgi:hypothetical protein
MLLREPVASSTIASIGYDEEREVLEVEFTSRAVYRYRGVSEEVFEGFLAARSKGTYFNQHIKDAYPWELVEG